MAAVVLDSSCAGRSASKTRVNALLTRASIGQKWFIQADGLHRNSELPELRRIIRRNSGKPDLRCQALRHGATKFALKRVRVIPPRIEVCSFTDLIVKRPSGI
jgi:hypothetical protein